MTSLSLFFAPWIAGSAYVLNSLLQPQFIWTWIFEGVPIFKITAGIAIFASFITLAKDNLKFAAYKNSQSWMLLALWGLMHVSNYLSPFKSASASVSPEIVLSTINSIMVMYFVLLPLCKNRDAILWFCYIIVGVGLYYTYWANSAYLNQEWYKFENNRLTGPFNSPYQDGNALSVLLIISLPFILFLCFRVKGVFFKTLIVLALPLTWHALILFSSRAALLASIITLILSAYIIKSKKINILLGVSFCIFLVYQGSLILNRTTDTIENAKVQTEEPINPRLISWEAGLKLIPIYPFLGVGVQKFEAAVSTHFPGMTPHVAHNTFLNFAVNSGIVSGFIFLMLIYGAFKKLKYCRSHSIDFNDNFHYALVSSSVGLLGFFVCSIFLDLIVFEPFYILLLINIISWQGVKETKEHKSI